MPKARTQFDWSLVTPFRRRVYEALLKVPAGKVITYGALGKRINCNSARAIGGALRHNPFAPQVPCHRVIGADRGLTGFGGKTDAAAFARKTKLLIAEGVRFDADGCVAAVCVLTA